MTREKPFVILVVMREFIEAQTRQGTALADHQIRALTLGKKPHIQVDPQQIQPASIDLAPVGTVWELSSIPPITPGLTFEDVKRLNIRRNRYELEARPTLLKDVPYLVELDIELHLPSDITAFCSPKSTSGRNDLHCMVIAEDTTGFDEIPAGYQGRLFVIIVPQSYPVVLGPGENLVQLRLFNGTRHYLSQEELEEVTSRYPLVRGGMEPKFVSRGLMLHLDLSTTSEWAVSNVIGEPVDLSARLQYDPARFFRRKPLDEDNRLHLEGHEFLLAFTPERVSVPGFLCAEMVAQHDSRGPFRAHAAGFIDPGYGGEEGGKLAYEIRNLARVPINLQHHQRVALLRFERLAALPERLYGATQASEPSHYQQQKGKDRLYPKQFLNHSLQG